MSPRAAPATSLPASPRWRRALATVVSVVVPGAGYVWMGRVAQGVRWWVAVSFVTVPIVLLGNLAPAAVVPVAWTYAVGNVVLLVWQVGATWRASREVAQWRGWWALGFAAVAVVVMQGTAFVVRSQLGEPYRVSASSMAPAALQGDQFFVFKLRRAEALKRGTVVAYAAKGLVWVKRLVGLPGDVVEVRDGSVVVNGVAAAQQPCPDLSVDDYPTGSNQKFTVVESCLGETLEGRTWRVALSKGRRSPDGAWTVPEGHVFLLGDNRDNSLDSRFEGAVPESAVLGAATAVWLSFAPDSWWPRWERIGAQP
jgi:signal peptidase I